jgi:hypothetical protein
MSMPRSAILRSTAAGGAAPPVIACTRCSNGRRTLSGALAIMFITIGAPHRCVTSCSAIASKIAAASTLRRQTWVPACKVTPQVNVQPLQWNIGRVQR